jgi:argininosuccinate synthase
MTKIFVNGEQNSKLIRSLSDLSLVADHSNHIVTLFSGGLDSSYVLKVLSERRCRVTALAIDLGGGLDHAKLTRIASRFGASLKVVDGRREFIEQAVLPALRANASYLGMYPISASLSRPLIARYALEIAHQLGAGAIVHTANQSQNSLRRLNGALRQLGYEGFYGTPYEYSAITREDKQRELGNMGVEGLGLENVSGDANLWCREFESGSLDNPEDFPVPEQLFHWAACSADIRDGESLSVTFKGGVPVALDDQPMDLITLIEELNHRAGAFAIGRYSGLEHLEFGEKVLEVREAPAAYILMDAFRQLETATLDAELLREKIGIEQVWVREAVEGRWFGDLRNSCDAFIAQTSLRVGGRVEYRLRAGAADACSIKADNPRYLTDRDNWEGVAARSRSRRELIPEDVELTPHAISNDLLARTGQELAIAKQVFLPGASFGALCGATQHDWEQFAACWDGLTLDHFMGDNGRYRYRRYAALQHTSGERDFTLVPHGPYVQSTEINKLNGGLQRVFDPLEDRFVRNPFFRSLVRTLTSLFDAADGREGEVMTWDIRIHPYRIIAENDVPGQASPEGLHRDGVDYIVSMMVDRHNVDGGETYVTDASGVPITQVCLRKPMDIILADDAATMHGVTPITPCGAGRAWRDVLVVAYTRLR